MAARRLALWLALIAAAPAPAASDPLDVAIGKRLFERQWVSAPASTNADDGLGPLFAATSCAACHPKGGANDAVVIRLSRGLEGDPVYGHQLQAFGVASVPGEARAVVGRQAGRRTLALDRLAYGPLDPATRIELRRPLPLRGLGAAAALGDDAIVAGEGTLGGRARRLPGGRIGRFGWKASSATIADQVAAAFSSDLGLSTTLFPDPSGDCTAAETTCRLAPNGSEGGRPEIAAPIVDAIAAYVAALPSSAASGTEDAPGIEAFTAAGCAACHRPRLVDAAGRSATLYSDLLLHDMGPGLAGAVLEPGVSSREWRTAPLAGLGDKLASGAGLLHDGRALTIEDAVATHGGTGAMARSSFEGLDAGRRAALITYLKGL
jgi:CxxC motif-containing protein (DUF1111 family)